jgi:hypothetical protein
MSDASLTTSLNSGTQSSSPSSNRELPHANATGGDLPDWVNDEDQTGVSVIAAPVVNQPVSRRGTTVLDWTPDDVVEWVKDNGGEQYASSFKNQGVGGAALIELDEDQLREIGVTHFGVRKRIAKSIRNLAVDARRAWRQEVIWEGHEHRPPCCMCLPYGFPFCCYCCIGYPASYRLTNSRLSLIVRDGCCRGLCAPVVITDNLELAFVNGEAIKERDGADDRYSSVYFHINVDISRFYLKKKKKKFA